MIPGVVTPGLAEPYVYDERYWNVPIEQTDKASDAGSLQWSIDDIAPWGDAIARHRVVSAAASEQAFAWHRLSSGIEIPYGFGFFLDRVGSEAVAPGFSYLDRPRLPAEPIDEKLLTPGKSGGPLLPDSQLISPDFVRVLNDPTEQRRFATGFTHATRSTASRNIRSVRAACVVTASSTASGSTISSPASIGRIACSGYGVADVSNRLACPPECCGRIDTGLPSTVSSRPAPSIANSTSDQNVKYQHRPK